VRKLRRIRAEKGLTMDALEERAGVSKRTISEIERGKRAPQTITLAKLAHALGVELDDLLEEHPKVRTEPLSFRRWLEERLGHSYLALSGEEIAELFEGLSSRADAEARKRKLLSDIHAEYLATTKTRNLPTEQRVLIRGHHLEATDKWFMAQTASGQAERITEEFERSIKEVLEAAVTESETA
jgi:transcriptional regulator with XRE-family HTH domain